MEDLEKMIRENREMLMEEEPSAGHFEKFEKRLTRQNSRGRVLKLTYRISRVAAVGLLMIMSSLYIYNEFIRTDVQFMNLGEVNKEYQEMEFFFTSQIDTKCEEIKSFDFEEDESFKENLLLELNSMDSIYSYLKQEMAENPGDERIIEAMIRHYQTKLNVISEILEKLKSQQENTNSQIKNQNQYESVNL